MLLKPVFANSVAELQLLDAGTRSIAQMKESLREDQVCFGVVRLPFGLDRFRRTKWVFVGWSGDKMPFMKRGPAKMAQSHVKNLLRVAVPFNLSLEFEHSEQITVDSFVQSVQRLVVTDGDISRSPLSPTITHNAMMQVTQTNCAAPHTHQCSAGGAGDGGREGAYI